MKKQILFAAVLLLFVMTVKGQEARTIRLSFVAEPQISWLKPDKDGVESRSGMAGYNFGVVLDRFFADNYAISTGLTINRTGGKLTYINPEDDSQTTDVDYKLRYLEIPIGLKLRSNEFRRTCFYGRFGLTPQINIEARDGEDHSIGDDVRLFDLGYHLGAGLEYSIGGSNALMFGIVYHNGFTDITDVEGYSDKTVLNRLVFEIGFIF